MTRPKRRTPTARLRRLWAVTAGAIILVVAGVVVWRTVHRTEAIPSIPETAFDAALKASLEEARAAVRSDSRSAEAWGRLAMLLHACEFTAQALECYAQAERFSSSDPRWPHLRGLLQLQGQPESAFKSLRRAAQLAGTNPAAPRLRLAEALTEQGRLDEAEAEFKSFVDAGGDPSVARLGLATIAHARGRLKASRALIQSCLTNAATARSAWTLLATIERGLGNATAAHAAAQTAAALAPDQARPDPYLAAVDALRPGLEALHEQGQQLLQQGRAAEALACFARATQRKPEEADPWLWIGRARLELKDAKGAEQALRRHLELAPASVNGHYQLGFALLGQERAAEAAAEFARAVELRPDFGEAHCILGFALARSGRTPAAIRALRAAIRYNPEFIESYLTLAELLNEGGEKAEAIELVQRALALNPQDERAQLLLRDLKVER